ncbi:hypothetical protein Tco_0687966 [Tanacetum coccineum]
MITITLSRIQILQRTKMLLMASPGVGAANDDEKLLFLAVEQVTNFDDDVDYPTEKDCTQFGSYLLKLINIQSTMKPGHHMTRILCLRYKSIKEEVTTLKKDFKQKEDKYIEEFLDIKKLKEMLKIRLSNRSITQKRTILLSLHPEDLTPEQIFWAKMNIAGEKVEAHDCRWTCNTEDKQCAEIERKNLLIANENLIANVGRIIDVCCDITLSRS